MRVFVTGTAGFIGFHLAKRLLEAGHLVDGYDGMTPYYDPSLKEARRSLLLRTNGYRDTKRLCLRGESGGLLPFPGSRDNFRFR